MRMRGRLTIADVYGDPEKERPDPDKQPASPDIVPYAWEHGTEKGYQTEYKYGLIRCRKCKDAHAAYRLAGYYRVKERKAKEAKEQQSSG